VEEVGKGSEQGRVPLIGRKALPIEIGPCRGDERAAAIRKHEGQVEDPSPVCSTENFQGLPL